MGAICQVTDANMNKVMALKMKYPLYNRDPEEKHNKRKKKQNKKDLLSVTKGLEIKLWDHYKIFYKYKNEIEKTNYELYKSLFINDLNSLHLEVKNVYSDDEQKFLFFVNKREFHSLSMSNCYILFPRFSMQYFPKFDSSPSKLKKIVINDSTLIFEKDNVEVYPRLDQLEHLDLCYNNIEELNDNFKKFSNLKTLILKRNSLTTLPLAFNELENLTEIDLTDNKLAKVPPLNFNKIVKLNLNMNNFETFEYQMTLNNPPLTYLFLANNEIKSIPQDLKKFNMLKHVALDGNKITEISHLIVEIEFPVKISLMNNTIKNKEMFPKNFLNDLLLLPINDKKKLKDEKKGSELDMIKSESVISLEKGISSMILVEANHLIDMANKEEIQDIEKVEQMEKIKYPLHVFEQNLAKRIEHMMIRAKDKNFSVEEFSIFIRKEKQKLICEELKRMINKNQESEIAKFGDFELKHQIKLCYNILNKHRDFLINGIYPEINEEERIIYNYVFGIKDADETTMTARPKLSDTNVTSQGKTTQEIVTTNTVKAKNDLDNLFFLNMLKHNLVSSKIKLYLKYLANIDIKLSKYFLNLIEDNEKNSLILILTELKLFLNDLIEYYQVNSDDLFEIVYEHKIAKTSDVIHKIFREDTTVKILYRIGLKGFKNKKIETAEFLLNLGNNETHKLLENFIMRLVKLIKTTHIDIATLE